MPRSLERYHPQSETLTDGDFTMKRISKSSKGDSSPAKLRVEVKHIPVPDAESRLRRAFDILLDSALNTNREDQPEKETPSDQAPPKDAVTSGAEKENTHESG